MHILEVLVNSPADKAGLVPYDDYVLGTKTLAFGCAEHFSSYVVINRGKVMELFVWNKKEDKVKIVNLTPDPLWGGRGLIGCEFADGVFHRIPSK